jgi:hypothetical protein
MWALLGSALDFFYPAPADAAKKLNLKKFLLHVAAHEGRELGARTQDGGGPGRSFFQFEPGKALDGMQFAQQQEASRGYLSALSQVSGQSTAALLAAASQLVLGKPWPAGNLLEQLLGTSPLSNDLFAIYLARITLARENTVIGTSLDEHATYWADHWKRVFAPAGPQSRAALLPVFRTAAAKADGLIPASFVELLVAQPTPEALRSQAAFFQNLSEQLLEAANYLDEASAISMVNLPDKPD